MSMLHNIPFLSAELQASIADMRAAGVSEEIINTLVTRIFAASEARVASLQESIIRIEDSIHARLDRLGDKLLADQRAVAGATNEMLSALHTAQLEWGPLIVEAARGVADIKKSWQDLDIWRGRVDTYLAQWGHHLFLTDSTVTAHTATLAEHTAQMAAHAMRITHTEQALSQLEAAHDHSDRP